MISNETSLTDGKHPKDCWAILLVSEKNRAKRYWDFFINLIIIYSAITSTYYLSFDSPTLLILKLLDFIADFFLFLDFFSSFFVSYLDPSTSNPVNNFSLVAFRYIRSFSFFVGIFAKLPLYLIKWQLKYLKLLRIFMLFHATKIFNSSKFESLVAYIYSCRLKAVAKGHDNMRVKYISRYCYKIFSLIMFALMLTYFCGCTWYMISKWNPFKFKLTFATLEDVENKEAFHRLIVCAYFALTTLSTVGYGELTPQNNMEKIVAILLMIVGIAFFSYIMGNFNDVLINYDEKMGVVDRGSELQVWLTSLSKFTSQKPLKRSLVKKIDQHFRFFWNNDRLSDISIDDDYLQLLPRQLRFDLITYLFDDVYHRFRGFFLRKEFQDFPMQYFFYEIAFCLLPRNVEENEVLINQGDDVNEIYFILEGEVKIEFTVGKEKIRRFFGQGFYFGDYYMLFDTPADYNIVATVTSNLLALPKSKLQELSGKYKSIYDKLLSNSIKNNSYTAHALQKSLREKLESNSPNSKISDEEVKKIYEQEVKIRSKQIRMKRIAQKNKELYKYTTEEANKIIGVEAVSPIKKPKNNNRHFTKNMHELEDIAKAINNLKNKLEKSL